jgi:flagellar basal body-associated protein FliL
MGDHYWMAEQRNRNLMVVIAVLLMLLLATAMAALPMYLAYGESPTHSHGQQEDADHSHDETSHQHSSALEHSPVSGPETSNALTAPLIATNWPWPLPQDHWKPSLSNLERPPRTAA